MIYGIKIANKSQTKIMYSNGFNDREFVSKNGGAHDMETPFDPSAVRVGNYNNMQDHVQYACLAPKEIWCKEKLPVLGNANCLEDVLNINDKVVAAIALDIYVRYNMADVLFHGQKKFGVNIAEVMEDAVVKLMGKVAHEYLDITNKILSELQQNAMQTQADMHSSLHDSRRRIDANGVCRKQDGCVPRRYSDAKVEAFRVNMETNESAMDENNNYGLDDSEFLEKFERKRLPSSSTPKNSDREPDLSAVFMEPLKTDVFEEVSESKPKNAQPFGQMCLQTEVPATQHLEVNQWMNSEGVELAFADRDCPIASIDQKSYWNTNVHSNKHEVCAQNNYYADPKSTCSQFTDVNQQHFDIYSNVTQNQMAQSQQCQVLKNIENSFKPEMCIEKLFSFPSSNDLYKHPQNLTSEYLRADNIPISNSVYSNIPPHLTLSNVQSLRMADAKKSPQKPLVSQSVYHSQQNFYLPQQFVNCGLTAPANLIQDVPSTSRATVTSEHFTMLTGAPQSKSPFPIAGNHTTNLPLFNNPTAPLDHFSKVFNSQVMMTTNKIQDTASLRTTNTNYEQHGNHNYYQKNYELPHVNLPLQFLTMGQQKQGPVSFKTPTPLAHLKIEQEIISQSKLNQNNPFNVCNSMNTINEIPSMSKATTENGGIRPLLSLKNVYHPSSVSVIRGHNSEISSDYPHSPLSSLDRCGRDSANTNSSNTQSGQPTPVHDQSSSISVFSQIVYSADSLETSRSAESSLSNKKRPNSSIPKSELKINSENMYRQYASASFPALERHPKAVLHQVKSLKRKSKMLPILCNELFTEISPNRRCIHYSFEKNRNVTSAVDHQCRNESIPYRLCTSSLPYDIQFFYEPKMKDVECCDQKQCHSRDGKELLEDGTIILNKLNNTVSVTNKTFVCNEVGNSDSSNKMKCDLHEVSEGTNTTIDSSRTSELLHYRELQKTQGSQSPVVDRKRINLSNKCGPQATFFGEHSRLPLCKQPLNLKSNHSKNTPASIVTRNKNVLESSTKNVQPCVNSTNRPSSSKNSPINNSDIFHMKKEFENVKCKDSKLRCSTCHKRNVAGQTPDHPCYEHCRLPSSICCNNRCPGDLHQIEFNTSLNNRCKICKQATMDHWCVHAYLTCTHVCCKSRDNSNSHENCSYSELRNYSIQRNLLSRSSNQSNRKLIANKLNCRCDNDEPPFCNKYLNGAQFCAHNNGFECCASSRAGDYNYRRQECTHLRRKFEPSNDVSVQDGSCRFCSQKRLERSCLLMCSRHSTQMESCCRCTLTRSCCRRSHDGLNCFNPLNEAKCCRRSQHGLNRQYSSYEQNICKFASRRTFCCASSRNKLCHSLVETQSRFSSCVKHSRCPTNVSHQCKFSVSDDRHFCQNTCNKRSFSKAQKEPRYLNQPNSSQNGFVNLNSVVKISKQNVKNELHSKSEKKVNTRDLFNKRHYHEERLSFFHNKNKMKSRRRSSTSAPVSNCKLGLLNRAANFSCQCKRKLKVQHTARLNEVRFSEKSGRKNCLKMKNSSDAYIGSRIRVPMLPGNSKSKVISSDRKFKSRSVISNNPNSKSICRNGIRKNARSYSSPNDPNCGNEIHRRSTSTSLEIMRGNDNEKPVKTTEAHSSKRVSKDNEETGVKLSTHESNSNSSTSSHSEKLSIKLNPCGCKPNSSEPISCCNDPSVHVNNDNESDISSSSNSFFKTVLIDGGSNSNCPTNSSGPTGTVVSCTSDGGNINTNYPLKYAKHNVAEESFETSEQSVVLDQYNNCTGSENDDVDTSKTFHQMSGEEKDSFLSSLNDTLEKVHEEHSSCYMRRRKGDAYCMCSSLEEMDHGTNSGTAIEEAVSSESQTRPVGVDGTSDRPPYELPSQIKEGTVQNRIAQFEDKLPGSKTCR